MKNKWRVGCFYTKDTPYEQVFKDFLEPSLIKHNLRKETLVTVIQNEGSWMKNVANKPRLVVEMLNQCDEGECLVILDADATIEKYPLLFDTIQGYCEIAFHTLSWRQWYGYDSDTTELLSGTMFFRNTSAIKKLCKEWFDYARTKNVWEQKALEAILGDHYEFCTYKLPIEYCYMKSRPGGLEPLVKCDPVILHHQASRELKRVIK